MSNQVDNVSASSGFYPVNLLPSHVRELVHHLIDHELMSSVSERDGIYVRYVELYDGLAAYSPGGFDWDF